MAYDKEKLSRFQDTVLAEADEKIAKLNEEATEYEKSELEKTRQQEYDKMFTYMQSKVRNIQWKYRREVTRKNLESKRKTLEFRGELVVKVFDACEQKLLAYASSEEYRKYLIEHAKKASQGFDCKGAVVLVRKEDIGLEKELLAATGAKSVAVDKANRLGGFQIENRNTGLLLDETLNGYLADQRQYFYETSGLTVAK